MFFPDYELRLRGIAALRLLALYNEPREDLFQLGRDIADLGNRLEPPANEDYTAWGALLQAMAFLARWAHALREAEPDAQRHVRAARLRAREVLRTARDGSSFHHSASAIADVADPEEIQLAATALLRVRLPLPFPSEHRQAVGPNGALARDPEPETPAWVAFLDFFVSDQPLRDTHELRPNVLYDLRLDMRLSNGLADGHSIEVAPYTVEPEGTVEAPTFCLTGVTGQTLLSETGRLLLRVPHDALARPLEISYGAVARAGDDEIPLKIHGQNRLLLRCIREGDILFGNRSIEAAVMRARDAARSLGVPDDELNRFLMLLGAVATIAAEALASNIFPGHWRGREGDFQSEMQSRLRMNPTIGFALEVHPHVAGGETDLSFHRVRLELKTDDRSMGTAQAFDSFAQQLAQYIVGSDRRTGVLAVLCPAPEAVAPGPIENDIALRIMPPPTGGNRELGIGIVLIRSNLQLPSSLSRR